MKKNMSFNRYKKVWLGVLIASCCMLRASHEFVVKKSDKKKPITCNGLKEQCGGRIGENIELSSHIVTQLGQLTERVGRMQLSDLNQMRALLEGEKNCFFGKANKEQLQKLSEKLAAITKHLELLDRDIERHLAVLAADVREGEMLMSAIGKGVKTDKQ